MELKDLFDKTLTFLDIEATDKKNDKRIIQLSGYKISCNKEEIKAFNFRFNPHQSLSVEIINLLKLDDDELSAMPDFIDEVDKISLILKDSILVSFGDFDKIQLTEEYRRIDKELDNEWFDIQDFFKKLVGQQLSLKNLYSLLVGNPDTEIQHDALYDSLMLKGVYYKILELNDEERIKMCHISALMPREIHPKHKIFSAETLAHPFFNYPNERYDAVFVTDIVFDKFHYKDENKEEHVVHYLRRMAYQVGQYTYSYENSVKIWTLDMYDDIYKPHVETFFKKILLNCQNRAFFFDYTKRENISHFVENIYDVCDVYWNLKYISLNYTHKLRKIIPFDEEWNSLSFFNNYLYDQKLTVQDKFKGFRTWNKWW